MNRKHVECTISGCGRVHLARGYCFMHYSRWKRNGSPDIVSSISPRNCIQCGVEFTPGHRVPHAQVCSIKCSNVSQYAKRKAKPPTRACERCGIAFTPLETVTRFCSKSCSNRSNAEQRIRDRVCLDCGTTYPTSALTSRHETCPPCSKERMLVRVRARNKVRRYLRRGANGPTHTKADWSKLVRRFGGKCAYCGAGKAEHRDHVIPITRGGTDSIGNILPSCAPCNLSKGRSTLSEWKHRKRKLECNQAENPNLLI